jgi:hypothetical protein
LLSIEIVEYRRNDGEIDDNTVSKNLVFMIWPSNLYQIIDESSILPHKNEFIQVHKLSSQVETMSMYVKFHLFQIEVLLQDTG